MIKLIFALSLLAALFLTSCSESSSKQNLAINKAAAETDTLINRDTIVYETEELIIRKFSDHIYQHISFFNSEDFGRVACNGMVVVNDNEAIIFDTPTGNKSSEELINFITEKLGSKINAVIPTHFHEDCVGGLEVFNNRGIPSYASNQTIEILKSKGSKFSGSLKSFNGTFTFDLGDKKVFAEYFGEGHTKDNIIGFSPDDKAVFGGCLIKEVGAGKGNLEDANVNAWPGTVKKLKQKYPQAKIVIPGHGKPGGTELFDYTINLFE